MGKNHEIRLFSDNISDNVCIYEPCTVIQSQDTRYFEIFYSYSHTQSPLTLNIFQKSHYQITEMEQQILKAINHIKYVSKKGATISGIQKFLKKKSTTTFDETSLGEIISEMQQNGKIDGKFKIINPIHDDKNFAEDPLEFYPEAYIPEESVDTTLINSNNDSYSETDKSLTD